MKLIVTGPYSKNLENKPKRQKPAAFVESIWDLPLQNEFLPEFDIHVSKTVSSLSLPQSDLLSFGDAFRRLNELLRSCSKCGLPYHLKLIFLGYCVTHQWTMWASLERGTPLRIIPLSLIEAPQFTISLDFGSASYGSLEFKNFKIDRMDLMEVAGSPDYSLTRWSDLEIMRGVELQSIRPDGNRVRSISLARVLSANDLSGEVRTIPRSAREELGERMKTFWEGRRIITGGVIEQFEASGEIQKTPFEQQKSKRIHGRPNKIEVVRDGFFYWLEWLKGKKLPGLTTAKKQISELLILLYDQNYVEETAVPRTIKDNLEALNYIKINKEKTVRYEWIPEAWAGAFEDWKKEKKIPDELFDSIEM